MAKKQPAKQAWGGARVRAGRKLLYAEPTVRIAAAVPQSLHAQVDAWAKSQGLSFSAALVALVQRGLGQG